MSSILPVTNSTDSNIRETLPAHDVSTTSQPMMNHPVLIQNESTNFATAATKLSEPPFKKRKLDISAAIHPEETSVSETSPIQRSPVITKLTNNTLTIPTMPRMVDYTDSEVTESESADSANEKQNELHPQKSDDDIPSMISHIESVAVVKQKSPEFADAMFTIFSTNHNLKQKPSNFICSPFGIQSAMNIAMCGAKGDTLKDMMDVLYPNINIGDEDEDTMSENTKNLNFKAIELCKYYNRKCQSDNDQEQPVGDHEVKMHMNSKQVNQINQLRIVNKLWISKNFDILSSFDCATDLFSLGAFDDDNADNAADVVNQWFSENTNNMINHVVDPTDVFNVNLLVTNAVHFSGRFELPFYQENTQENVPFYSRGSRSESSTEIGKVSMMYSKGKTSMVHKVDGIWDVIKLKYVDLSLSLFLVIDQRNGSGSDPESGLKASDLMNSERCKLSSEECELWIPKFRIEHGLRLKSVKGAVSTFDQKTSAFTGIDGSNMLHLGDVIQKVVMEVDDEDNASDIDSKDDESVVQQIRLDRPFAFHLIDEDKKVVLLSGLFEGK